jgi:SAM-dependent methyltransferase
MAAPRFRRIWQICGLVILAAVAFAGAQQQEEPFTPEVGQPGKDVVWVPSPPETVEKMMDMAMLRPDDFVVDLGSGDGRNVIAAAKRGARGLGVEYNPKMVELSRRNAAAAGVADKAQFVEGDMFEADFSKATVLALFLLPSNLLQLRDKILDLRPGSRIVANTFGIQDWTADETATLDNCSSWCTVLLYIVPAKVGGAWRLPQGELMLDQSYQMLTGTLATGSGRVPMTGRLRGAQITFSGGGWEFSAEVRGNVMEGTVRAGGRESTWRAVRAGTN